MKQHGPPIAHKFNADPIQFVARIRQVETQASSPCLTFTKHPQKPNSTLLKKAVPPGSKQRAAVLKDPKSKTNTSGNASI